MHNSVRLCYYTSKGGCNINIWSQLRGLKNYEKNALSPPRALKNYALPPPLQEVKIIVGIGEKKVLLTPVMRNRSQMIILHPP